MLNEFNGLTLTCSNKKIEQEVVSNSVTCFPDGEAVLSSLGFNDFTLSTCAWALVVVYFGCLFIAYTILAVNTRGAFLIMKSS